MHLIKIISLCFMLLSGPISAFASVSERAMIEKNYFQFTITDYRTTRQSGQTVDIYVRYAYKKNLPTSDYPDYRALRTKLLTYMEPSEAFPTNVYWEILATEIGKTLMHDFPLDGVSVQLIVHDNQTQDSYEPGDHGPIFTMGDIMPLSKL